MLVDDMLRNSVNHSPDKTALVIGGNRLSYTQFDALTNRMANLLAARGVKRADRVAIVLENSLEAAVSVFGILKAGAVFMTINPTTKAGKLRFILNNSRASALVTDVAHTKTVAEIAAGVSSLAFSVIADYGAGSKAALPGEGFTSWAEAMDGSSPAEPPRRCIDVDLASLIYTSGTTGNPKGVMMTHHNVISAATSITRYLENVPSDIILNVLPFSFDYGLYQLLMSVKIGATLVVERSFAYPYAVLKKVAEEGVTGLPCVPTMYAMILQMKGLEKLDFSALRYLTNTGAALPVDHIRRIRELFPRARLYSMYGLTECKRVSYLPPDDLDRKPGSVGKGMPNEEVYIVDDAGDRVGPGVAGELVVRGSNVMRGYWENPDETAKMLRPGPFPGEKVLHTGDLFRSDEDGYLYFLARKDDIIKSRGEKVSPKEVENAIHALEGVVEAAVVGVPDEIMGHAIKAFVVPSEGSELTEKDVIGHCARTLEDFMVPKYVVFRESLPKNPSGKILKSAL